MVVGYFAYLAATFWDHDGSEIGQLIIWVAVPFVTGLIFGFGLILSGMCWRTKVLGFLTMNSSWDISLMFVMGGGVMVTLILFNYMIHVQKNGILTNRPVVNGHG